MVCYVGLVYPRPRFGLLSRGEAVRGEPAQYISMRAPETTVVVPNGSHYRDSQYRYIYIQRKCRVEVTSVGLAHARPIIQRKCRVEVTSVGLAHARPIIIVLTIVTTTA